MTAYDFLMDFALMSILLFVAQILRAKVRIIQKFLLPCSLIAGFLGLFLGNQFLDIIPFSDEVGSYPYMLVVFLFASLFIGNKRSGSFKDTMNEVGDTFLINSSVYFLQYAIALVVGGLVLRTFFKEVPDAFSVLMPGGFIGGHGAAAAFGGAFSELINWDEALPIAQTFATIGLVFGVLGGIVFINIGTRKKWTRFIRTIKELPDGMRTGMNPPEEREIIGKETINNMSLDSLTWHFMLILMATCGGYYLTNYLQGLFPKLSIPMFSVAMLFGVLLQGILKALRIEDYVDKSAISHIGSMATDYLVSFGIATIKVSVVIKYIVPILILTLIGILFVILYLLFVSKKLFSKYWFEKGIFIFGWSTGVIAIGVTLLRIVDPNYQSRTLEDYGMAYIFISFIEIGLIAILPTLIVSGFSLITGIVLAIIGFILLSICKKKYGVFKDDGSVLRPGEIKVDL
ncbi:sodium/glutamate symporter [Peptoniphilus sp.]|jgi:ESS family glutamate:Na+ symporter|uniref:sodium/glutamate symporter n=1 Tax=Peptoniphilus sp. TaxID=1971214 RepID=UPI003D8ABDEB